MTTHDSDFRKQAEESARRMARESRQMVRKAREMIAASKKLLNRENDSESA